VFDGDSVSVGSPLVDGARVQAEILGHGRDKKIRVFKMKRRKKYRRTQGHRQAFTQLRITDISG
jgi:large subunit ribosomal protein L21